MKIQGSYEQNINLLDMAEKTTPRKKMSEVLPERKEGQGVLVDISEAGMEAWRKQTREMSPTVEATEERVMTAADTNEVESEHYSKISIYLCSDYKESCVLHIFHGVFKSEHPLFHILNTPCSSLNCINI